MQQHQCGRRRRGAAPRGAPLFRRFAPARRRPRVRFGSLRPRGARARLLLRSALRSAFSDHPMYALPRAGASPSPLERVGCTSKAAPGRHLTLRKTDASGIVSMRRPNEPDPPPEAARGARACGGAGGTAPPGGRQQPCVLSLSSSPLVRRAQAAPCHVKWGSAPPP
ncbi:MAG: hypothetical protein J3K34DRAFT_405430 [Monoraphidium minutum]|nr:MAG: hypothetical protein J3K34DRAFT_405430 [Monoraphidium minutum]